MSLGHTASAPHSTWLTAVRASSSSVASLSTAPSRTSPQWPCEVYSQRQTSVSSSSSGKDARSPRSACWTIPSSSQAPEPSSSLDSGIPKSIAARTPSSSSSSASRRTPSAVYRPMAGSSAFESGSGATKSGMTKSSRSSLVSRTSERSDGEARRRLRRVVGKTLTRKDYDAAVRRRPRITNRLRQQPARAQAREHTEHRADSDQPGGLVRERPPRAHVEESGGEEADRVHEREQIRDPARRRHDLAGHKSQEHHGQDDQDGHERGRSSLTRQPADQR